MLIGQVHLFIVLLFLKRFMYAAPIEVKSERKKCVSPGRPSFCHSYYFSHSVARGTDDVGCWDFQLECQVESKQLVVVVQVRAWTAICNPHNPIFYLQTLSPSLQSIQRKIWFMRPSFFTVVWAVRALHQTYFLHTFRYCDIWLFTVACLFFESYITMYSNYQQHTNLYNGPNS